MTKANENYELRVVTPEQFDATAFDWATTHLRCQYAVRSATEYSSWPSTRGSELLLLLGVAQETLNDVCVSREAEDNFVAHALQTLRKLREAAVASNVNMLEEVMGEQPVLEKDMAELFKPILPLQSTSVTLKHKLANERYRKQKSTQT